MNLEQTSLSRNLTRRVLLQVCMAALGIPSCFAVKPAPAPYGAKVRFSKGVALHFLNFDLTYLGTRKEASKVYPRGFLYHDFEISGGGSTKTVAWSAGTGDIGPTVFQFGGSEFWLELSRSDKLGKLAENEMVIWKK